ncbi:MAG: aldehyde-activating protein [Proteobacteria bacterium]|nr:aldehyde-activating protein [Pseudomonadota bacterium]
MGPKGACHCGSIRFELAVAPTSATACHCTQCRKQSGHFFASANLPKSAVNLSGSEHLAWYRSFEKVRRGFCARCGSWLFWEPLQQVGPRWRWAPSTGQPAWRWSATSSSPTKATTTRSAMALPQREH